MECQQLEEITPRLREILGNIAMPGFTSPKLPWVWRDEPELFAQICKLRKDYLRYGMTGDSSIDMSDSADTLWIDVGSRTWDEELLDATGLTVKQMLRLYAGNAITSQLRKDIAEQWGMPTVFVLTG